MNEINIYCDESNHLENSNIKTMVLGAVYCPKSEATSINQRIREIKARHNLSKKFELKWTKVSKGKLQFYLDIVDYFFDNDALHFRSVIIDKATLNHAEYDQTHDEWYYKMYFTLLNIILDPKERYCIYLDIKDTQGSEKVKKLREVLCNSRYDFKRNMIKHVQQVRSEEIEILQLTDLLIGALQFTNRTDVKSEAKAQVVSRIKTHSGYDLSKSTLPKEDKVNLFYWKGGSHNVE